MGADLNLGKDSLEKLFPGVWSNLCFKPLYRGCRLHFSCRRLPKEYALRG